MISLQSSPTLSASMHKISPQNAGNGIKETPADPLEVLVPSALVGQTGVRPWPPKISNPVRQCKKLEKRQKPNRQVRYACLYS